MRIYWRRTENENRSIINRPTFLTIPKTEQTFLFHFDKAVQNNINNYQEKFKIWILFLFLNFFWTKNAYKNPTNIIESKINTAKAWQATDLIFYKILLLVFFFTSSLPKKIGWFLFFLRSFNLIQKLLLSLRFFVILKQFVMLKWKKMIKLNCHWIYIETRNKKL